MEEFPEYEPPMRKHGINDKNMVVELCEIMRQDTPSSMSSWLSVLRKKIDKSDLVA